ncbi:redoxin domain-containing protein [Thiolinea disciformis]|uniref:redoxin domain-containing protein n=1 Tax=Thiolinea disciformis TaxID=125614 RepID=UPI000372D595|nr:redoxin domain-containing protein [Thiolinea disciformis]
MGQVEGTRKKRRWVWIVELAIVVGVIWGIRAWQQQNLVDGVAPDFSQKTLDNKIISLANYRDKPVMLHFWATWCAICEMEQGGISKVVEHWPVITIAYDDASEADVSKYMEKQGIKQWTTVHDPKGELARSYGVSVLPTTYILDGQGRIRFHEVGFSSSWGLRLRLWLADNWLSTKAEAPVPAKPATASTSQTQ